MESGEAGSGPTFRDKAPAHSAGMTTSACLSPYSGGLHVGAVLELLSFILDTALWLWYCNVSVCQGKAHVEKCADLLVCLESQGEFILAQPFVCKPASVLKQAGRQQADRQANRRAFFFKAAFKRCLSRKGDQLKNKNISTRQQLNQWASGFS